MRLFVLRHAERAADDATFASPLLPQGEATAAALATTLAADHPRFTHVYTSPFLRCVQTLAPYCAATTARTVRVDNALYEWIRGDAGHDPTHHQRAWPWGTHPHLDAHLDASYASWWPLAAIPYDESEEAMRTRVRAFRAHLEEVHSPDDVVLLVTHLSAINALLHRADEAPFAMGHCQELPPPPSAV